MESKIEQAIDDLSDKLLEQAFLDFLTEHKLLGEFLVWIEKWKYLQAGGE